MEDPEDFDQRVKTAMCTLGVKTILTFFRRSMDSSDSPEDSLSNKIVLLLRKGPPNLLRDDRYFVTFKTWKIRALVQNHFAVRRLEQARRLLDATKGLSASSTLAAFAFESLADVYISGKQQ